MNLDSHDDREVAAGQYVIGLLDESERLIFEAALVDDTELAGMVARWQDNLLPIATRIAPIDPPASLWQRIDATLLSMSESTASRGATNTARAPQGPGQPLESPSRSRPSLWESLMVWRSISAAAVAASVLLSAILLFRPPQVQVYYAVLRSPTEQVGWLIQARTAGTLRLVPLEGGVSVPAGKALELWTKAEGASGPTSLGLIKPNTAFEISVDQLPTLGRNQLFEITLEPETGSPIGKPTGPVQFIGKTEDI